jgi:hypothetical protein
MIPGTRTWRSTPRRRGRRLAARVQLGRKTRRLLTRRILKTQIIIVIILKRAEEEGLAEEEERRVAEEEGLAEEERMAAALATPMLEALVMVTQALMRRWMTKGLLLLRFSSESTLRCCRWL